MTEGGDPRGPYRGRRIALATLHGKAAAVGPAVRRHLGAGLVVPPGLDTDAFGTFAGDVPRTGTMGTTALAKARAGRYSPQEHAGVVLCAMYWHALDAIWVVLYGTLWAGSR